MLETIISQQRSPANQNVIVLLTVKQKYDHKFFYISASLSAGICYFDFVHSDSSVIVSILSF